MFFFGLVWVLCVNNQWHQTLGESFCVIASIVASKYLLFPTLISFYFLFLTSPLFISLLSRRFATIFIEFHLLRAALYKAYEK